MLVFLPAESTQISYTCAYEPINYSHKNEEDADDSLWSAVLCELHLQDFSRVIVSLSVSEHGLDARPQSPVADCQNSRWHGDEDNVGKTSNDQKKICGGTRVVVEVVDRDNAGSPGRDEEHDESKDHLKIT